MRLLNTKTGRFEEFVDLKDAPPYAILSHTWDKEGEQSYQDVVKIQEEFGLSSASQRAEVLPNALSSNPVPTVTPQPDSAALPNASELDMRTESTLSTSQMSRLSPPMLVLLRSLLVSILARVSLYLLSSSIPPYPAEHGPGEIRTPSPSPPCRSIWDPDSGLSEKIRKARERARLDGYEHIWVDSSCIDKTSSSELSEAINSMFNWYRGAQVCYAFLADVPTDDDLRAVKRYSIECKDGEEPSEDSKFRKSRWFERAWTLQELIAPRLVVFLSQDWEPLGTKNSLADLIEEITHIDRAILTHKKTLAEESVAERMRWAAKRQATRVEDEAYSLLGIFGITMPTLYGEGAYAFRRLQEEILQRIPDQSLFAWGPSCEPEVLPTGTGPSEIITVTVKDSDQQSLFAPSPHSFELKGGRIIPACPHTLGSLDLLVEEYTPTPYGIRTRLLLLPLHAFNLAFNVTGGPSSVTTWYFVILGCQQLADNQGVRTRPLLSKLCYITSPLKSEVEFLCIPSSSFTPYITSSYASHIFPIAPSATNNTELQTKVVYLLHPKPPIPDRRLGSANSGRPLTQLEAISCSSSSWTQAALRPSGYTISDIRPTPEHHLNSYSLTLFHASFHILIQYRHMSIGSNPGTAIAIEARIWTLPSGEDEDARSTIVQHTPPYSSAIWVDHKPWAMALPPRRVHLVTPSQHEVTLQLELGLITSLHYNTHIEIATDEARGSTIYGLSTRVALDDGRRDQMPMEMTHTDLKFTTLGSVRKALEKQKYSVLLAAPNVDSSESHSYTLIIYNPPLGFIISIKYFYTLHDSRRSLGLAQELIIAACVVLKSSVKNSDTSEPYVDGPYVVSWEDDYRGTEWRGHQELKQIVLTAPTGDSLTLCLGLDLAWQSEYYLVVNIGGNGGSCPAQGGPPDLLLDNPHDRISLMLPGHIKRALQMRYKVDFERPGEAHSSLYHLTLSDANLTIVIEYSHNLTTCQKKNSYWDTTFRACVTTSSSKSPLDRDTQSAGQIVDWDAWRPGRYYKYGRYIGPTPGWHWDLPPKDVTLALPTGAELTLRLGFYLVWTSEYCITVEIIPPSPQTSHEKLGASPADTDGRTRNIGEDSGDDVGMQTTVASEAHDPDVAHSDEVAPGALPLPGVVDAEVQEAGASEGAE